MFSNDDNMNFLFYVGIIVPTIITITLFLVFIYCWFVQKARKEVLTKKYDPHGKMRRLGLSMDPPPPPAYCRMEDSLLPENGEDNVAYDVSRSPSTEQDGRGRPMYHTYHDSGISPGLSPSQESEPRPGLAYRTCPDSGISGFGPQPPQCSYHANRGCCQPEEQFQRQHYQQVYGDHMQINTHQQLPYHQQLPQAALHQNLVQASVHPTHGVCYGDDMSHPHSPQHYSPQVVHPTSLNLAHYNDRHISLVAHIHKPPAQSLSTNQQLPFYPSSSSHQLHHQNNEQCYHHANEITEHPQINSNNSPPGRQGQDNAASPVTADTHFSNRANSVPSVNFHLPPDHGPDSQSHQYQTSPSSPTKPPRHAYKDSCGAANAQPTINGNERPDSQASQSSTTDSEDSGFRSSHCAAHYKARLSKQGNPLLKPLRRTKNSKTKPNKSDASIADSSQINGATPLITLNPQNLQTNVDNSNVIQNTSLMDVQLAHRPSRFPQQSSNLRNNPSSSDRVTVSSSSSPQAGVSSMLFHDGPPVRTHQHSPIRENWPSQSVNDEESNVNQNIDLNDISTHLSWKYLQDLSSNNNAYTGTPNGGMVVQACHQGIRSGQILQSNQDQHIEMFGFSVV